MATNFPTSLDTFTNPNSGNTLDSPSHSIQHSDINDAVEAIEAKIGVGSSTAGSATAGYALVNTSGGTTAYTTIGIAGITSGTAISTAPLISNGSGGVSFDSEAWSSYTPTFTNLTVGNGTISFKYKQIGKTVFVYGRFVFGSTSSMGTSPAISLPVTAVTYPANTVPIGQGIYQDTGTNTFAFYVRPLTTTSILCATMTVSGSNISTSSEPTSTTPFTWTSTDSLNLNLVYEAA